MHFVCRGTASFKQTERKKTNTKEWKETCSEGYTGQRPVVIAAVLGVINAHAESQ